MALNSLRSGPAAVTGLADPPPPPSSPVPVRRITNATPQQEGLWSVLEYGVGHVVVEARAGCGKSSSCREGMYRMRAARPGLRVRYAVFNKANADEFRASCPDGVEVGTSHAFGLAALKVAFRSSVEKNKTYLILDETRAGRNLPRYIRKSVAMLVSQAKGHGYRPDDGGDVALDDLVVYFDINDYGRPQVLVEHAQDVLKRAAEWTELVDFDDMLWLPGLHQIRFPACDALFLDEVQDFNAAQHALVPLMCRSGRVIAVGDSYQAINAFRGADMDSIPNLSGGLARSPAGLTTKPLTITFRCPKSHVALANAYVADLTAAPSAPEGVVRTSRHDEMLAQVEPGDLVICPTNGPVVSACLKLIAAGRPAYVRGRAIGDQLLTILRGGGERRTVSEAAANVQRWERREMIRLADLDGVEDLIESVQDRAAGLQAILSACESPAEAEPLIGRLFADERRSNVVTFSTVHRAKGDEAERVWLIEPPLKPMRKEPKEWQLRQDRNLRYVALTRSKRELIFVKDE
jgi:DNA helicase-2/ATP-dependent DNA helicase PcrA